MKLMKSSPDEEGKPRNQEHSDDNTQGHRWSGFTFLIAEMVEKSYLSYMSHKIALF